MPSENVVSRGAPGDGRLREQVDCSPSENSGKGESGDRIGPLKPKGLKKDEMRGEAGNGGCECGCKFGGSALADVDLREGDCDGVDVGEAVGDRLSGTR